MADKDELQENGLNGIAIIGMSVRFPKANTIEQYWDNLIEGRDCIDTFTIEDVSKAGVSETTISNPHYIRRGGRISNPEFFDASFFGYTPREASLLDPQQRIFLKCGWEAIESAGYDVSRLESIVGVFAGCGMNHYLLQNIIANAGSTESVNEIQMVIGNDKDFLTSRLSYKLNLRGPSLDIQSACSTSLVAVHVACQNLLTYQCDVALAGGVFLQIPWWQGYKLTDGDIRSSDGICRPFDIQANGTVFGEGAGVVVLKRLQEAINDGDHIFAVIKGTAINNDGSIKAGYTAPGVDGQANVITMALESAGVKASEISYIETHGTGTPLGDPIELSALTKAFRHYSQDNRFCGIGSVKASIGHLDAAAGIAGLIKTVLSLYHKQIPPSLNYNQPNPLLDIDNTPFFVVTKNTPWKIQPGIKRLAGVSSLGVGGTNAHVILEEAPEISRSPSAKKWHLLPFSAKSDNALKKSTLNISEYLQGPVTDLADIAYTLQNGRQQFPYRQFTVTKSSAEISQQLDTFKSKESAYRIPKDGSAKIVFMFSGQGSQYINMGRGLYEESNSFRSAYDKCCALLLKYTGTDFRVILFSDDDQFSSKLLQTNITQPLLFSFEHALVKMWEDVGIVPSAMIGHSIGEYVAACQSGVFTLEEALYLVAERGRIMHAQPPGKMISINLPAKEVSSLIDNNLQIALKNSPSSCVVAGQQEHIDHFQTKLSGMKIDFRQLNTSHAFHSSLMNGAVAPFTNIFTSVSPMPHTVPFISNVSGTWILPEEVSNPAYWGRHLRDCVNFSDGVIQLLNDNYRLFLEIGPGNTLASFVKKISSQWSSSHKEIIDEKITTITSVRHSKLQTDDTFHFLNSIGQLWQCGASINWKQLYMDENRLRITLPTYPFEEKKHWIDSVNHPFFGMGIRYESQKIPIPTSPIDQTPDFTEPVEQNTEKEKALNFTTCTSLERSVMTVWKELLGIDDIDPTSSFFELGGDSIWAARMLARIREKTGVDISIGTLYTYPSIKDLLTVIEAAQKTTQNSKRSEPVRSDKISGLTLSSSQQRLWFLHQLEPNSPAFNLAAEFEITGPFDADIAHKTIDKIINRHDSLRTTFIQSNDGPLIQINQKIDYPFEIIDFSCEKIKDDSLWINEIRSRSIKCYDLQTGPLIRILLIRLSEKQHILTVMTHHIISDGWSMGVFLKDFANFYDSIVNAKQSSLPELAYRFADYAKWQSEQYASINNTNLEYWKHILSGPLPILELPSDKMRPPTLSYVGSSVHFSLSKETSQKLEILTRKEQTTIFSSLLSIFYILLARYSGQSDIIIGAPVANRNDVEVEKLFGFFLNMMPLRIQVQRDQTFSKLLQHIKEVVHDAFAHQDIPFNVLVETIKPQRDLSHPPIFQVIFAYQNFPIEPVTIGETKISSTLVDRGATEFDLSLYMWPNDNILTGNFEYSTELFERSQIERLASHFVNIANAIADTIDTPVSMIKLLSDSEYHQINYSWNNTYASFPEDKCVHNLFSEAVQNLPTATAVIYNNNSYSYEDLDIASDRIAQLLTENGVKTGDLVGICLERHFGMVAVLLGILKSGAAYVPIDPNYPLERINYMVLDAQLKFVITEERTNNQISHLSSAHVLVIEPDLKNLQAKIINKQDIQVSPQNTAYIIYTSGSTGKPKGVRIPHRAAVNFLTSMRKKPGIEPTDAVLAVTTLSFDISVLEILLPLTTGARCIIAENEITKNGLKLIDLVYETNPTIIQGTPSFWRLLNAAGWKCLPKVKAICGGEPLTSDLIREILPNVKELWNGYGPTETTVYATFYQITDLHAPILIGYPIDNTLTYILDNTMQTVPIGVPGELFIGGVGLAEGYHNQQDLTAEKFIANPFCNGRIYRTGDQVRYHQDGAIQFIGRIDSQVKIRGFRIELGEVENVILTHPQIRQCAATCKEFTPGDLRLILHYTLQSKGSLTPADVRKYIKAYLPEYMVPQHFIEIEVMPLTPAGKIDRKQLPSISDTRDTKISIHPRSSTEKLLADIWMELLGIKQVSINDNFFELGGHSLLAVQMFSKIFKKTGINLPIAILLRSPTIEQLSSELIVKMPNDSQLLINQPTLPQKNSNPLSYVVPIKSSGSRPPFFCVHCVGGNVLNYNAFVPYLDKEQLMYGLQCRGLDGIIKPFSSLNIMVKSYVEELRQIQPHGPYRLGGGSMGGLVAFEMAQQLIKNGESIALLVMFDSICPQQDKKKLFNSEKNTEYSKIKLNFLGQVTNSIQSRIRDLLKLVRFKWYQMRGCVIPHELRYWYIERKNLAIVESFQPEPYEGLITMFRATHNKSCSDSYRGWKNVAKKGMTFFDFACDHENLIEQAEVAQKLNEVLKHSNSTVT